MTGKIDSIQVEVAVQPLVGELLLECLVGGRVSMHKEDGLIPVAFGEDVFVMIHLHRYIPQVD